MDASAEGRPAETAQALAQAVSSGNAADNQRPEVAETLDDPCYHRVTLPRIPGYHKLDKTARLADVHGRQLATNDRHIASNTWHVRLTSLVRSISKTGPRNYYARLQALYNPHR